MVEMEIRELQMSDALATQIVVLEEKDGARRFPIFIGPHEAMALYNAIHRRMSPRPLTHDLILNALDGLGAELEGVLVDELANDVYHGKLLVRTADFETVRIDTRPSDAMVLAMKKRVPIYVAKDVLDSLAEGSEEEEP
jgi:bifunctional DNase/RNase